MCLYPLVLFCCCASALAQPLPTLERVLDARLDLWGEAAMRQPNGASYEFFENLLPPPRYVNADFHFYPIVLSVPNAKVKARLISNGSGVNLRGGARGWNDVGLPLTFRVGADEFRFGEIVDRLEYPTFAQGYLPIPTVIYGHGGERYQLEAFAATEPALAEQGMVFVRFSLASGLSNGLITVNAENPLTLTPVFGQKEQSRNATVERLTDSAGVGWVFLDRTWTWERQRLHATITSNRFATLAIVTRPATNGPIPSFSKPAQSAGAPTPMQLDYQEQRQVCVASWQKLLAQGMNVETPEPLVNNAWRNLIIQDFSIINGDRMNYSAGNQYEKMYAAESSDAAIPLALWGYEADVRRLLPVIFDLVDKRLPHHFAGHKLEALCQFYWPSRDVDFLKQMQPRWQKELDLILNGRGEHGLVTKENYCTDMEFPVHSFPANAVCWAALRDMAPVLQALGDNEQARRVGEAAAQFKRDIFAAVEKNERHETDPPFIPMALFYGEDVHDPITETRLGSYWDLIANYIIGSRLFAGSDKELWLPRYIETHGGLCMGLTRSAAASTTFWTGKNRTNPLYGMRYILDALRRDDVERALVSFYGMLAQGMTRNTFVGAEGCSIQPLDEGGRFFYCPPNSAGNGQWLAVLRYLLVQDWDHNNDGSPETLRLAFGTPRRWLENGKRIKVERAPTAFGPVSFEIESRLAQGEIIAHVDLPSRNSPEKTLFRVRPPASWIIRSAMSGSVQLAADANGTVALSRSTEPLVLRFLVEKVP